MKLAGGINIADRAAQEWPRLSIEYIIATAPEVILDGQMGSDRSVAGWLLEPLPVDPGGAGPSNFRLPGECDAASGAARRDGAGEPAAAIHPVEAGSFKVAAPARNN